MNDKFYDLVKKIKKIKNKEIQMKHFYLAKILIFLEFTLSWNFEFQFLKTGPQKNCF
jgi:hypothetical protein